MTLVCYKCKNCDEIVELPLLDTNWYPDCALHRSYMYYMEVFEYGNK